MNLTCCHVAVALAIANITQLVFFFNYSLKIKASQVKLEKKNGKEQHQLDELKKEVERLKAKSSKGF